MKTRGGAVSTMSSSMAKASAWGITSPLDFEVTWHGGQGTDAISARASGVDPNALRALITSHSSLGILPFHAGRRFSTAPGWRL